MKPKIYFLPGTMCNNRLWSRLFPLLQSTYELIHLKIPDGESIEDISDNLLSCFKEEVVNLVGFSLGGYLASYFACKYPKKVNQLLVISNSPCSLTEKEALYRKGIIDFVGRYGYQGMSRSKAGQLLDTSQVSAELIDLILKMDSELGEQEFKRQLKATSNRVNLYHSLATANIKATFYYSELDPLLDVEWLSKFKQNSRLKLVSTSGKGHMLPLEKPKELASYLKSMF